MTPAKRVLFALGGLLWWLFSLGFGFALAGYVTQGAGQQFFGGPVSSESVLLGLAHVTGFVALIIVCFAIGAGLCAHAWVSGRGDKPAD